MSFTCVSCGRSRPDVTLSQSCLDLADVDTPTLAVRELPSEELICADCDEALEEEDLESLLADRPVSRVFFVIDGVEQDYTEAQASALAQNY